MICSRCKKELKEYEEHHLFPKFMDNPHGYTFETYPNKVNLCFTCHKALHQTIIIPLLNKFARTLKRNGSEHYLWNNLIAPIDKPTITKEVLEESYIFIFDRRFEHGDTRKTEEI